MYYKTCLRLFIISEYPVCCQLVNLFTNVTVLVTVSSVWKIQQGLLLLLQNPLYMPHLPYYRMSPDIAKTKVDRHISGDTDFSLIVPGVYCANVMFYYF